MSEEASTKERAGDEAVSYHGRQPDQTESGGLGHRGPLEQTIHRWFNSDRRRCLDSHRTTHDDTISARRLLLFRPSRWQVERHDLMDQGRTLFTLSRSDKMCCLTICPFSRRNFYTSRTRKKREENGKNIQDHHPVAIAHTHTLTDTCGCWKIVSSSLVRLSLFLLQIRTDNSTSLGRLIGSSLCRTAFGRRFATTSSKWRFSGK